MDFIIELLANANWAFIVICTTLSIFIWAGWFHPKVFGTAYARWMKLPLPEVGKMPQGMVLTFICEFASRILYFIGLFYVFYIFTNLGQMLWENLQKTTPTEFLFLALFVWFLFVFPAQLSQISWTQADKRAIVLITWSTLIQTVLASIIWFRFFV